MAYYMSRVLVGTRLLSALVLMGICSVFGVVWRVTSRRCQLHEEASRQLPLQTSSRRCHASLALAVQQVPYCAVAVLT